MLVELFRRRRPVISFNRPALLRNIYYYSRIPLRVVCRSAPPPHIPALCSRSFELNFFLLLFLLEGVVGHHLRLHLCGHRLKVAVKTICAYTCDQRSNRTIMGWVGFKRIESDRKMKHFSTSSFSSVEYPTSLPSIIVNLVMAFIFGYVTVHKISRFENIYFTQMHSFCCHGDFVKTPYFTTGEKRFLDFLVYVLQRRPKTEIL